MSLAQITEKIINDATREAEAIVDKAKSQAEDIARRTQEENDTVKSSYDRRFELEKPEIFRRREIVANLDVKKMSLQSQRDIIRDVYVIALEKMKGMPKEEYLAFCEALLGNAVSTKEEIVTVGANEKFIDQAWIDEYNKKNGAKLTLADKKADISGGLILTNGKIDVNCSWEMLIKIAQEKFEADVVKRLFKTAE